MAGELGRRIPTDDRHLARWALTAETVPGSPVPVVLGIWWYQNFDHPQWDAQSRRWWIGRGNLGGIRGGHAICVKPASLNDVDGWWHFYDQGAEGACTGFAASRMMSLLNRDRYDARLCYLEAKKIDEWEGEDYDGTSVRAAMDVLRTRGLRQVHHHRHEHAEEIRHGIQSNRWCLSVDDVLACLASPSYERIGAVPLLNSWGRNGYPHTVWLPLDTLDRLMREDGEATMVVDRVEP